MNKTEPSSGTSASLLRLTVMAALGFIVVTVMTGCGNGHRSVGRISPEACQSSEATTATSPPAVGQPAPFFSLMNQEGKTVSPADLKGSWVVLYFYPKDDTPGCLCEATEFTDLLSEFQHMNARVLGVNADTVASHLAFRDKCGLTLDLLSDPEGKMMRQYGAYVDTHVGNTNSTKIIRSTFLINQNGRIAYHWPDVTPQGHAKRVKDRLAQIQHGATKTSLGSELDMSFMATLFKVFI